MSISAAGKDWNSPTTLYLARKLAGLAAGRRLAVLDLGCGDGTALEQLAEYGHDLCGCDLPDRREALEKRLGPLFGESFADRIRTVTDEKAIPFESASFDVVYANQVFEHVRDLKRLLRECARVLRPRGIVLATFPPATSPVEVHLAVPFAHWLPPGAVRVRYLQLFFSLGIRPRLEGCTALETARRQDVYLRDQTFYRTARGVEAAAGESFGSAACDTEALMTAKLDMMEAGTGGAAKLAAGLGMFLNGPLLAWLTTRLVIGAYAFSDPKQPTP